MWETIHREILNKVNATNLCDRPIITPHFKGHVYGCPLLFCSYSLYHIPKRCDIIYERYCDDLNLRQKCVKTDVTSHPDKGWRIYLVWGPFYDHKSRKWGCRTGPWKYLRYEREIVITVNFYVVKLSLRTKK